MKRLLLCFVYIQLLSVMHASIILFSCYYYYYFAPGVDDTFRYNTDIWYSLEEGKFGKLAANHCTENRVTS